MRHLIAGLIIFGSGSIAGHARADEEIAWKIGQALVWADNRPALRIGPDVVLMLHQGPPSKQVARKTVGIRGFDASTETAKAVVMRTTGVRYRLLQLPASFRSAVPIELAADGSDETIAYVMQWDGRRESSLEIKPVEPGPLLVVETSGAEQLLTFVDKRTQSHPTQRWAAFGPTGRLIGLADDRDIQKVSRKQVHPTDLPLDSKRVLRLYRRIDPFELTPSAESFGTEVALRESAADYDDRRPPDFLKTAFCLLYTSPSPRDATLSRMPSSA